jgi:CRISPR-associated endonuclease/helicase Cas3
MEFYAHSTKREDRADWQLLRDHLLQVGERAARYATVFGGHELAQVAGRLHDLGKYTEKFQRRLQGEIPKVDHATWGALVAQQRFGSLGTLLAYGIAGHHAGLANGRLREGRPSLCERLSSETRDQLPPLLADWQREIELPQTIEGPRSFTPAPARKMFQIALLARMIFSCLVDADFVDTDNFYRDIEGSERRKEDGGPSLQALRAQLDAHLAGKPKEGGINPHRADILAQVRRKAAEAPGLFSLTVPTGGGKTLASLAFALDHALIHGLRRIIYVIPFTSIVEQNAQVFRDAFGELGEEAVLEHHSGFFDDPNSAPQSIEKRKLAMENWDAPVVVTTAVQFFEGLFADRPSRCRKLHNIAGSVVILDEAQTFPLPLLRPCVALLDELALNYRASLVLCTATQPALTKALGFRDGLENVRELTDDPQALYRQLRRVTVRHIGTVDDEALTDHLRQREQVLCIVNNRRHARHLFESLAEEPGAFHLTTFMHARHRSRVLAEVRQRLKNGEPCRLIATSLIEAGVDVDFPAVLRAEAGLESIAQAGGRCNREGRRSPADSEVLVFQTGNADWAPPQELKLFADAFRTIERAHRDDLLAPEAITAYFQELYWRKGDDKLDAEDVLGLLRGAKVDSLPLESLAQKFRLIRTSMRPIIVPYDPYTGKEESLVSSLLRDLAYAPALARKLQPYLVQVPQQGYDALWQAHAIQPIAPDKYGEQFVQLVNPRLYDKRFGLHWDDPQFMLAEGLVL